MPGIAPTIVRIAPTYRKRPAHRIVEAIVATPAITQPRIIEIGVIVVPIPRAGYYNSTRCMEANYTSGARTLYVGITVVAARFVLNCNIIVLHISVVTTTIIFVNATPRIATLIPVVIFIVLIIVIVLDNLVRRRLHSCIRSRRTLLSLLLGNEVNVVILCLAIVNGKYRHQCE